MQPFAALVFLLLSVITVQAQVVASSVCAVLADPQSFDGKLVRITGTAVAGFDQFVLKDAGCGTVLNAIWLDYPAGARAKAGPALTLTLQPAANYSGSFHAPGPRTEVKIERNKEFEKFDALLAAQAKSEGLCLGCSKNEVKATLTGRIDAAKPVLRREKSGRIVALDGFGHLNAYGVRLVIASVSNPEAQPIDYTKSAAATRGEGSSEASNGDGVAVAQQAARAFAQNPEVAGEIRRAAAAFGEPGQDNGVMVNFGGGNEWSVAQEGKSERNSPDGIIFNLTLDPSRLKGRALGVAISAGGVQIADLRSDFSEGHATDFVSLESRGMQLGALTAIGLRTKTLSLRGGYLLWNQGWAPADRDRLMRGNLDAFLHEAEYVGH